MPSSSAYVVRGGMIRDPDIVGIKIAKGVSEGKIAAISVHSLDPIAGESREETLLRIVESAKIPHNVIQVARHSDLTKAGFALVHDTTDGQAECHYNVSVSFPVDNSELDRFISCFTEPETKPKRS